MNIHFVFLCQNMHLIYRVPALMLLHYRCIHLSEMHIHYVLSIAVQLLAVHTIHLCSRKVDNVES